MRQLKLTIDDLPKTAQPILETAYGPFLDKINTLIKYSIENQDFEIISLIEIVKDCIPKFKEFINSKMNIREIENKEE